MADATIKVSDLQDAAKRCLRYREARVFAMWSIDARGMRLDAYFEDAKTGRVIDWASAVQVRDLPMLMRQMELRAIHDLTGDRNMSN